MLEKNPNIMDTAFEWCATLSDEEVSNTKRMAFDAWLNAAPENKEAFDEANRLWQTMGEFNEEDFDESLFLPSWHERLRISLLSFYRKAAECFTLSPVTGGVVTLCALILVALALFPDVMGTKPITEIYHTTLVGETRTIQLEDGSELSIGPDTSLAIRLSDEVRLVRLMNGEVFFDVAKDSSRPFEVISGRLKVTVVGTAFSVQHSNHFEDVAVAEGLVSVAYTDRTGSLATSGTNATSEQSSRTLAAGERSFWADDGTTLHTSVEPEMVGAWRKNLLVYTDAPLSKIVDDINRYRKNKVYILEPDVGSIRLSATFNSKDIDGMLQTLTAMLSLQLDTSPGKSFLRSKP